MALNDIRKLMILSVASDEVLSALLVLKGGNALQLVHSIGTRSSLELDFSLEGDFADPDEIRERLFRALQERFGLTGYHLFDEEFGPKPRTPAGGVGRKWGGYKASFKLIGIEKYKSLGGNLEKMRVQSEESGPEHKRAFEIEISKYEYCSGNMMADVDTFPVRVYTPAMIAIEKLRAVCQQMPEYLLRRHPAPRARDFYDIEAIITETGLDLTAKSQLELFRNMFAAKEVPLKLLGQIHKHRDFHRQDWPAVEVTVSGDLRSFDYYFDFAVQQVDRLKTLWVE